MKNYLFTILTLLFTGNSFAQDYKITFSGSGESNRVDSVFVENISQGIFLRMGGNDTLVLQKQVTGTKLYPLNNNKLKIYPNPSSGESTIEFYMPFSEKVIFRVFDLSGKEIAFQSQNLEKGLHRFKLNDLSSGLFIVNVHSASFVKTEKIVSNGVNKSYPILSYQFLSELEEQNRKLKSASDAIPLPFPWMDGDVIILTAESNDALLGITTRKVIPLTMTENEMEVNDVSVLDFSFVRCIDLAGKSYSTVNIGNQTWMTENFAYQTESGSWEYDNNEDNIATYGRLYTWETAIANAPEGWHLPTDGDWEELNNFLTQNYTDDIMTLLKNNSGWVDDESGNSGNGSNSSGFSALPGGARWFYDSTFYNLGSATYFWSATELEPEKAHMQKLTSTNNALYIGNSIKKYGFSVRYIKNEVPTVTTHSASDINSNFASMNGSIDNDKGFPITECGIYWSKTNPNPGVNDSIATIECLSGVYGIFIGPLEPGTKYYYRAFATNNIGTGTGGVISFTTDKNNPDYGSFNDDRDGSSYKTIQIGDQIWMAENLRYLPAVSPSSVTHNTMPYYYVYGYDGTTVSEAKEMLNYQNFGVLYNMKASQLACPEGWHLPTKDEWEKMFYFLLNTNVYPGGFEVAQTLASNEFWDNSTTNAWGDYSENNKSGFSALPGGLLNAFGEFSNLGKIATFWTATPYGSGVAYAQRLLIGTNKMFRSTMEGKHGLSVRCIKD